jgi:lysophospholipase L1-like esterase
MGADSGGAPRPPGSWGRIPDLALSAGSIVVALLLVEAGLRLSGFTPERHLSTRRLVDAGWTWLLDCYPSNPRGYFDIDLRRPESRRRYRRISPHHFDAIAPLHPWAVEFHYNELRFRDAPLGPKPPGVKRIMVLGDSFTEGQGVKEEDTMVRVLARRLDALAPGRFEVRNCGRRATDFPELYGMFEEILPFQPDLVVYALVLNDAVQAPEFQASHRYVADWILDRESLPDTVRSGPGVLRSRVFDFVSERVTAWRLGQRTVRWYLDMWSDRNPGWAETQVYIKDMAMRLDRRGARLLVAPWPLLVGLREAYPFRPVHQTIEAFCRRSGIAYHDMLPVFLGRSSADLWVHPVDHHPNEVAQRLAGESLVPVVMRLAEGS